MIDSRPSAIFVQTSVRLIRTIVGGVRGLVVGRWTCIPEVPGSGPPPCHWMDLSSVAPNSTPRRSTPCK